MTDAERLIRAVEAIGLEPGRVSYQPNGPEVRAGDLIFGLRPSLERPLLLRGFRCARCQLVGGQTHWTWANTPIADLADVGARILIHGRGVHGNELAPMSARTPA